MMPMTYWQAYVIIYLSFVQVLPEWPDLPDWPAQDQEIHQCCVVTICIESSEKWFNNRDHWVSSAFSFIGGSDLHMSATWHKFEMVWLYRSPVPVTIIISYLSCAERKGGSAHCVIILLAVLESALCKVDYSNGAYEFMIFLSEF